MHHLDYADSPEAQITLTSTNSARRIRHRHNPAVGIRPDAHPARARPEDQRCGRLLHLHHRGEPAPAVRRGRRAALGIYRRPAWTVDRGHGRIDVRTIKTLPPTPRIRELFPHVEQVFLVERYSYSIGGELPGAVAVLGITSLPPDQAGPADLLAYLRGHWSIEVHHYVRDVVPGEDASRNRSAQRAMAAVRNAVAGILRLHQVPNIAAQLRANHRDPYQLPMQLPGLMTPLAPNSNPAVT